ncbi:hypothetical protein FD01_GL001866 [Lacticaseibacillus manihotivorans DSM 13343 = JCM 12514]|jgi:hypothetical protein|uniref:Uncharacterized protein n=2 Tax=Lacticaseibacillus manihotivorans TaxID=88233 RepID=A0A0R1QKF3_9LACO|nr:hypothetical protein FD01_GL001866 [Lacticaseibacillus manihotivorans DSM 13343 = JCM 12514]
MAFVLQIYIVKGMLAQARGDDMMNAVKTLTSWYELPWWVGFKEVLVLFGFVLGMISGLIGVVTYRRNTAIRAQDVRANQIRRTYEVMVSYPITIRGKVLTVTQQLNQGIAAIDELRQQGVDEGRLDEALLRIVMESELVELLHVLDPYGFLLGNQDYLFADEVLNTFASEVRRVLLNQQIASSIDGIMKTSTMSGITQLQQQLRDHQAQRR